ncbi:hypothetical protein [Qipengyuania sp. 483]
MNVNDIPALDHEAGMQAFDMDDSVITRSKIIEAIVAGVMPMPV